MKVAVISDIHGNLEAFREVLADIDKIEADSIICLGDLIGYGPNPEEVVELLRSRSIPAIMGNHELALARADFLDWFNETARESLVLSERLISAETRNWLRDLDATLVFEEALFVHGCPPNSITEYIFEWDDEGLEEIFSKMDKQICFVGHTHTLEAISFADATVRHHNLGEGISRLVVSPNTSLVWAVSGNPGTATIIMLNTPCGTPFGEVLKFASFLMISRRQQQK